MAEDEVGLDKLIQRALGDVDALGQLFLRYRPYLLELARQRIGPRLAVRSDASDIVQQTFLEAQRDIAGFRGSSEPEFTVWIRRIHERNVAEVARKHIRAAKQSLDREQPLMPSDNSASLRWVEPAADQTSPSQRFIRGEKALRLAAILETLPEAQREAVRLRHLEGWPIDRIAEALDRTPAATAGLIKRGLEGLRARMSADSWGDA